MMNFGQSGKLRASMRLNMVFFLHSSNLNHKRNVNGCRCGDQRSYFDDQVNHGYLSKSKRVILKIQEEERDEVLSSE